MTIIAALLLAAQAAPAAPRAATPPPPAAQAQLRRLTQQLGRCTGTSISREARTRAAEERMAANVIAACRDREQALRRALLRHYPAAQVETGMRMYRQQVRQMVSRAVRRRPATR